MSGRALDMVTGVVLGTRLKHRPKVFLPFRNGPKEETSLSSLCPAVLHLQAHLCILRNTE